jgi:two-component system sensor histidine kinase KdpD
LAGLLVGLAGVAVVTAACYPFKDDLTRATPALLYVIPVGASAAIGGRWVAVFVAACTTATFSVALIPPVGTLRVALPEDALSLVVCLAVALVVGSFVAREADRRRQDEQREGEIASMHEEYRRLVREGSCSPRRPAGSRPWRRSTSGAPPCSERSHTICARRCRPLAR